MKLRASHCSHPRGILVNVVGENLQTVGEFTPSGFRLMFHRDPPDFQGPSVEWEQPEPVTRWIATDEFGDVFVSEEKPFGDDDAHWSVNNGDSRAIPGEALHILGLTPPDEEDPPRRLRITAEWVEETQ